MAIYLCEKSAVTATRNKPDYAPLFMFTSFENFRGFEDKSLHL